MPKDDPEEDTPKKRPARDEEDDEFDKEIEDSMDEDDLPPTKSSKKTKDDEDPLDHEDNELDDDLLKAGNKEVFADSEGDEDLTPKPTFKYNAPPPPSEDPVLGEHTLDDLSEEDIAPQPPRRPFQVDRGFAPQQVEPQSMPTPEGDDDFENSYPTSARPTMAPMPHEDEFSDSDNLSIPSIRKQNPLYPPHQSRGLEDQGFQQRPVQPQRQQYNPYREGSGYGPDSNQRFGYRDRQPRGASKWHIIILLLIGGAVIGATVYLLQNQFNFPGQPEAEPTSSPVTQVTESTPAPTPTPAPIERSEFKVRVLNGTTEKGIAGETLNKLKELGYQTDRAGNAPEQDHEQTLIRVKEGEASLSSQLTKDLAPDYDATIVPDLDKDANVDAEIILGEK